MLQVVIAALAFLIGTLLGVRLLAALYAPLDLWYTIRTAWPTALRRIVAWSAVTAAALLVPSGVAWRWGLLAGMGASLIAHVATWALALRIFSRPPGRTPVVE